MLDRADGGWTGAEVAVLRTVQRRLVGTGGPTGADSTAPAVRAARGLSHAGEHAAGWLALGALGAALDRPRRRQWLTAATGVAGAHGASIVLKRVVRRRRPHHPSVEVHVGTPSRLSFPSSHATSTTAAALLLGGLVGRPTTAVTGLVPAMALSRMVLGVHYPTDVLAGSALGAVCALGTRRAIRRGAVGRWRTA